MVDNGTTECNSILRRAVPYAALAGKNET